MFTSLTHASKLTFCLGVKSVGITAAPTINKLFTSSSLRTEKPSRHEAFTRALDHWQTADIASCKASKAPIVNKSVETFRFAFSESFSNVFIIMVFTLRPPFKQRWYAELGPAWKLQHWKDEWGRSAIQRKIDNNHEFLIYYLTLWHVGTVSATFVADSESILTSIYFPLFPAFHHLGTLTLIKTIQINTLKKKKLIKI